MFNWCDEFAFFRCKIFVAIDCSFLAFCIYRKLCAVTRSPMTQFIASWIMSIFFQPLFPKMDDEICQIQRRGKRVYAFTNVTQGIFSMLMQITLEIRSAQLLCALNHTQSSHTHTNSGSFIKFNSNQNTFQLWTHLLLFFERCKHSRPSTITHAQRRTGTQCIDFILNSILEHQIKGSDEHSLMQYIKIQSREMNRFTQSFFSLNIFK